MICYQTDFVQLDNINNSLISNGVTCKTNPIVIFNIVKKLIILVFYDIFS